MVTHTSFSKAREEFDRAWHDPASTVIEPEPVDVNALLEEHYSGGRPFRLTKRLLWEAEVKKAWDPAKYIPGVVREGTSWGRKPSGNAEGCFQRASRQRAWRSTDHGRVLEEVYLSPEEQTVLFLGRAEFPGPDGDPLWADGHQPLFHVEHAVGGTESRPLNLWRIVHLTPAREDALIERESARTDAAEWVRKFVAIYLEKTLGKSS